MNPRLECFDITRLPGITDEHRALLKNAADL